MTIIGTDNIQYRAYRKAFADGKHNGAYYYAKEIEQYFVPVIKTNRNWDVLGMRITNHVSHSIVFIHHNIDMDMVYKWLEKYDDMVLVVSQQHVYDWAVKKGHKAILLPLSIDTEYVKKFSEKKTKNACYAGNRWDFKREDEERNIPDGVDFPPANMDRKDLLRFIAPYKKCYAIGRCALEAKVLGCKIMPFYWRYMNPSHWKVLDSMDAAKILQQKLDEIDGI